MGPQRWSRPYSVHLLRIPSAGSGAGAVAVLCPLSYILVLTAMTFTPVSYVAPAREISILVATAMGTRLLAEGDAVRRSLAALTMVMGIVCLAVG